MYRVIVSPGYSVPDERVGRSHGASVHSDQSTGAPPDAMSVMTVVSPAGCASTVSLPGPRPVAAGGVEVPVLITSTETSGEWRSAVKRGSGFALALPAFS